MNDRVLSIRVPGSTSNLGLGFDSIGLALNRHLCLEVVESDKWSFQLDSPSLHGLAINEDNLICKTASALADEYGKQLPFCNVKMTSDIPLARGIGSSAAAIIAGIELAERLLDLGLTQSEKLEFAAGIEGHADNVAASLTGGLVITTGSCFVTAGVPDIDMVVVIPSYELKTKESRSVLPESLSFKEAVKGSGAANVMVAAMLQGDWGKAGKLMSGDVFHQPYRLPFVPYFEKVSRIAKSHDAFGTAISGAGPSLICFTASGRGKHLRTVLKQRFSDLDCQFVRPDRSGLISETKIKTPSG